ncbi:SAICAR synthase-like protein [Hymenopellis radicata]|nr:SAICAR synthase-like protein [Hymenopellis radicata]
MAEVTHTIPLASQVGGHAGVLTSEDGSLLIKPALPLEHKFYQYLTSDPRKATESDLGIEVAQVTDAGSLVLENLSHPFSKPNILDIKLGTVLYDESASLEKIERMLKAAQDTTSWESGVRLTGFQVYDNTTGEPVNTPKSYGKSIKVSDLPDGIAKFFPVPSSESTSGIRVELLLPILKAFQEDIRDIREAYASCEIRMVGGSLLLVYEGDAAKAEEGVKWMLGGGEEEEEEDNEEEEDDARKKPGPPYTVKLIDFAHTHLVPGHGPDEGVLKGVDTVLSLLDGRIKQLESL